ncbi:MAG: hypothetical protein QW051_05070 [Candidatus Aenigmatarchaeota archaeon]
MKSFLSIIFLFFYFVSFSSLAEENCWCNEKIQELRTLISDYEFCIIYYISKNECFQCGLDEYILKEFLFDSCKIGKVIIFDSKLNLKEMEFFRKKYKKTILTDDCETYRTFFSIEQTPTILVYSKYFIERFRFSRRQILEKKILSKFEDKIKQLLIHRDTSINVIKISLDKILNIERAIFNNNNLYIIDNFHNTLFIYNIGNGELLGEIKPFSLVDSNFFSDFNTYTWLIEKTNPLLENLFIDADTIILLCRQYYPKIQQRDTLLEVILLPRLYFQKIFYDNYKKINRIIIDTNEIPNTRNIILNKKFMCFYSPLCLGSTCDFDTTNFLFITKLGLTKSIIKTQDLQKKDKIFNVQTIIPNFTPTFSIDANGNGVLISELNRYFLFFKFDTNNLDLKEKFHISPHGLLFELFCFWDSIKPSLDFFIENPKVKNLKVGIGGILLDEGKIYILLRNQNEKIASYVVQSYTPNFVKELYIHESEKFESLIFAGIDSNNIVLVGKTKEGSIEVVFLNKKFLE